MNLYTGYFAKAQFYVEEDLVLCSVAQFDPPWFKGYSKKELAPEKELLTRYHSGLSFGQFAVEYLSYLEKVDFGPILEEFDQILDECSGIVLCCYYIKVNRNK